MAKQKYLTEYPAILKEKAKNAGVKIKKADYRFLDCFMLIQEEAEYPEIELELMEESEEMVINFTTHMGESIHMMLDAHDASEVKFKAKAASIPASLADSVGKSILTGCFINNYLALQITLENLEEPYVDVVMEGNLWIDGPGEEAAGRCSFYLLMFIEQINQINHALSETGYEVRLTNSGPQKVKAIKTVRELTGWGLKEAKAFVDAAPDAVLKVGSEVEAMHYRAEFAKIGAQTEIA